MASELPDAAPDPFLGRRINSLIIKSRLAEGGMGVVYLAQHERLQSLRRVIKFLLPECARVESIRQRFGQEAEAAAKLRHDNIIKIVDHGTLDDGHYFLVMEHLEGETLDEYLRRSGRLDAHRSFGLVAQIASALQHAHDHGIVHRDLKPSNVFLTKLGATTRVILLDFGIAKDREARSPVVTSTGMALGTPAYMATEQHEDASRVSPAADVFSLGVLTWQLLTGELPWGLHSAPVLYRMQREGPPIAPPEPVMSREIAAVLYSALAPDALCRPQSARELAVALASAIPAMPPDLSSGAEILRMVASDLVIGTPHDLVTLQHRRSQERLGAMRWSQREASTPVRSDAAARPPDGPGERGQPRHHGIRRYVLLVVASTAFAAFATYGLTRLAAGSGTAASSAPRSPVPVTDAAAPASTSAAPARGVVVTVPDASAGFPDAEPAGARDAGAGSAAPEPVAASLAPSASRRPAATPSPARGPGSSMVPGAPPAVHPPARPPAPARVPAQPDQASERRTGELVVRVRTWAEVFVDGKHVGQAPLRITVTAGPHDVLLVHDEHRERMSIEVTSTREAIIQKPW